MYGWSAADNPDERLVTKLLPAATLPCYVDVSICPEAPSRVDEPISER
jgi:hypothetical protein